MSTAVEAPLKIAAFFSDRDDARELAPTLSTLALVTLCHSAADLMRACKETDLVLLQTLLPSGKPVTSCVRMIRARAPSVPIVAYVVLSPASVRVLPALALLGVKHVLIRGEEARVGRVREVIEHALQDGWQSQLWSVLEPFASPSVRDFLEALVLAAAQPVAVGDVAASLHTSARTLNDRLSRAGLPTAQDLAGWTRLSYAAFLLTNPSNTIERVADLMGYGSSASVHALVRRYTGLSPSQLRAGDPLRQALTMLSTRLALSHRDLA